VAVCNDCHTPPGLVPKYVTKARNGFWHSFYFTTGGSPDPLGITPRNHQVTEAACQVPYGCDRLDRSGTHEHPGQGPDVHRLS
jgi:cytochrome c nitrite reductase small subunit